MTCNVGQIERPIRILLGIILIGIGAFGDLPVGGMVAALIVGTVALVTGVVGYCPAWALFGVNTSSGKDAKR